ncbi:TIR-like protein FxsC [Paractinoplanes durhamensis]|uniref:Peptidase C14 caspase domain-containing protein n=1 Tax=Paractinoplanes durhamensis TaxID=113563 RepID=A0ABQ3YSU2_9ACTN|nr:TIR-like protein FxsC [Actinoplanes durhamensis]GIE00594.1 hypothetical protein Adu01nite_19440 [Actinoplanes durhamensis]
MYRALLICNFTYHREDGQSLPALKGPRGDGPLLGDALTHHQSGLFDDANVATHFDLTTDQIRDYTSLFFLDSAADDVLLLYFSGHSVGGNEKLYLCGTNTDPRRFPGTAVSNDSISEMIRDSPASAKVVVLDSCQAGAWKGEVPHRPGFGRGSYLIGATTATQQAPDAHANGRPSPFTRALVDGLVHGAQSSNEDGQIDLADLFNYLKGHAAAGQMDPYQRFEGIGRVPIARRAVPLRVAAPAGPAERVPFLDETTALTTVDPDRVARFRADLRPDIVAKYPAELTDADFLARAHLLRDGRLTRAGVLLFGAAPTAVFVSAIVQCRQIRGVAKDGIAEDQPPLDGSVPEQIMQARDFVAALARRGDRPTEDSAAAQPFYEFPMITVREVIANALVHRDYELDDSCVHVRFYADRIEVVSPGHWVGAELPPGERRPLGDLAAESKKRNFRLAGILTWIRVVEGEGSGIPRALQECRRLGAPEPTVSYANGMVIVTIHPVPLDLGPQVADEVRDRTPYFPGPVTAGSYLGGSGPLFFLSYARTQQGRRPVTPADANRHVVRLFDDLSENVAELVGIEPGTVPGFMDLNLVGGEHWEQGIRRAATTCQVFVPLLAPPYVRGGWTAMEWKAFEQRPVRVREGETAGSGILPVIWAPLPEAPPDEIAAVPLFLPELVPPEFDHLYRENGLLGLLLSRQDEVYDMILWRLAQEIARKIHVQYVEPIELVSLDGLPRTFGRSADQDETIK